MDIIHLVKLLDNRNEIYKKELIILLNITTNIQFLITYW